jgi:hypothetical protein
VRIRSFVPVVLVGCLSAACTAGREESVPTTAAPTTIAAATAPATTEARTTAAPVTALATTVAATTVAPATVAPTTPLPVTTGIVLPPDLGHLVALAPGVSTPGDIWQLAPKLWLFLPSESAGDPNLTPPKPEDAEILIAYARKQKALQLAGTSPPVDLSSVALRRAYTPKGLEARTSALKPYLDEEQFLVLGSGIVYRPRVLSEPRTTEFALVWDCSIDGSFLATGAELAQAESQHSESRVLGVFSELRPVAGDWRVDLDGPEELACA